MNYRGHVRNGVVVFDGQVNLPDGTEVRIETVDVTTSEPKDVALTLYERLEHVIGTADGLPSDASSNVDHYLYGHPKRQ